MLENNTNNCNSTETANLNEKEIVMAFILLGESVPYLDGVLYLRRSLCDNLEPGKWGVVAGHIEKTDANPLAAVIREVDEEAGFKVDPIKPIKLRTFRTVAKGFNEKILEKLFAHAFLIELPQYFLKNVTVNPETHLGKVALHIEDIEAYYNQLNNLPPLRGASKTTIEIRELTTPDIDLIRACFPAIKEIKNRSTNEFIPLTINKTKAIA